jgi:hypothetical protein
LNHLGRFYNDAQIAVELNKYDSCFSHLRINLNYPNMYRWKHIDSVNMHSNKLGWVTNAASRPRLWHTLKRWLMDGIFLIKSENVCYEMQNFVKDDIEDQGGGADKAENDDDLLSLMIALALYTANEGLYNEAFGLVVPRRELTKENANFIVKCRNCGHDWPEMEVPDKIPDPEIDPAGNIRQPPMLRCPICQSIHVGITRANGRQISDGSLLVAEVTAGGGKGWSPDEEWDRYTSASKYEDFW